MAIFSKQPKTRDVFLSKESGNDFPLDKKNRPIICKEAGDETSIYNAMSSKGGSNKIKVFQKDFTGNVKIKPMGSYLNIDDDYEIPNNFRKQKIGKYIGEFKNTKK